MNTLPEISIVIPVYNDGPYLRQCLDSVAAQTMREIEIICVDDGSTDDCPQILAEFLRRDSRVQVLRKSTNSGSLIARRDGAMAAAGEYILFVDADDYLDPQVCAEVYRQSQKELADILQYSVEVTNYTSVSREASEARSRYLRPYPGTLDRDALMNVCFCDRSYTTSLCGKLFKTQLCKQALSHIPDMRSRIGEDIYSYFLLGFYAKKYVGIPTQAKYHYCYGRGVSNCDFVSLAKFEEFCGMGQLAGEVKRFLISQDSLERFFAAYFGISKRMCEDACNVYSYRLSPEDKPRGQQLLARYWQTNEAAHEVFNRMLGQSAHSLSCPDALWNQKETAARSELTAVRASASYKIGRAITFFPRKLRGGVRCLLENGLGYTLRRAVAKIKSLLGGNEK